jgi:hypothetical protein
MKTVLFLLAFLFGLQAVAQPPKRFYTSFGGDGDDIAYSGKPTLDGQYIVAGSSSSYGAIGNTDVFLVKVDSMGFPMWEKYFGGFGNEVGKSVIQLPDSGYVIAGFTSSFGAGGYDAFILRTDKNGNLIWQRTFGGTDWDFASDLVLASDGNIFVVGNTISFGSGKKDGFILKYNLAGDLLVQKLIGGPENEELRSIIKTNDNFLATVGYTESKGDLNGDGYFLKIDLNADTIFTKTFGGPFKDYAKDIVQKNNDEYILCGAKTYSSSVKSKSYMYSISSNGSFIWENSYYDSSDDENFESMSNSFQLPTLSAYIRNVPVPSVKIQGNILLSVPGGWFYKINSFGGSEDELFHSIEATKDGGYFIVGSTLSFTSKAQDIFLMKHDSTCFNYISVVGVKENSKSPIVNAYSIGDKKLHFQFFGEEFPESISLYDLSGNKVTEFQVDLSKMEKDFSWLNNSFYLLRFQYKNGQNKYQKIILR